MRFTLVRLAVIALLLFVHPAQAQPRVTSSGAATCANCSIELVPLTTIGRATDDLLIQFVSSNTSVAVDSRGRIFVTPTTTPGVVAVFDSLGTLRWHLGRHGQGPGEIMYAQTVQITAGDTAQVYDTDAGRLSLFTPGLAFARVDTRPGLLRAETLLILRNGTLVGIRGSSAGTLTLSNGRGSQPISKPDAAAGSSGNDALSVKILSPAIEPNQFWIARQNAYQLELRNAQGALVRTIVRTVPWFPEWTTVAKGIPNRAPSPPQLIDIWQETPTRLWVLTRVAPKDWRASTDTGRVSINDRSKYVSLMIEVMNPTTGAVLVSREIPGWYTRTRTGGIIYRVSEDADGIARITLSRLRLVAGP